MNIKRSQLVTKGYLPKIIIKFKINEETEIPQECIDSIPSIGPADEAVKDLRSKYEIKVDENELKTHLDRYGCWDEKELEDHDSNIDRLLWLACLDCVENNSTFFYMGE